MTRAGFKGYYVLLTGDKKTPEDGAEKKIVSDLKLLKKTAYNDLKLSQ